LPRMRVHELASRYGLASKALIELLQEIDISVHHHMCGLEEGQAREARKLLERIRRGQEPLVFLCYSTKDNKFMRRLRGDLTEAGLTVWTAERITPGTPAWTRAVEDAITRSRCTVVILSKNAKKSVWVTREIHFAEQHAKRIVPVLARDRPADAVPLQLAGAQWIDVRSTRYQAGARSLIRALRRHLGLRRGR
jgi:hypothetical protein